MFFNRYWINYKEDNTYTRVLKVLQYYENKPVWAWKLSFDSKVLHYTNAVMTLRRKGYNIENTTKRKGNILHSNYRLIW